MASIEEYHVNQATKMAYVSGQSQGASALAMENFFGGFMATTGGPMGLLNRTRRFSWNNQTARQFALGADGESFCAVITGIGFVVNSYTDSSGNVVRPTDVLSYSGSTTSTPDYKITITETGGFSQDPKLFPNMGPNEMHIPLVSGRYFHVPVYYMGLDNAGTFYQGQVYGDGFPESLSDEGMNREGIVGSFPYTDEFYFVRDGTSCGVINDSKRLSAQRFSINTNSNADSSDLDTEIGGATDREEMKNRLPFRKFQIPLNMTIRDYDTNGPTTSLASVQFQTFDIYGMVFRFNR